MRNFDFTNVKVLDFIQWEKGYHVLTITSHKEDVINGKDVDIFEVASDTGATTKITLYYTEKAYWTYLRLLNVCGAKSIEKGNLNLDNLVGKRFGASISFKEVDKIGDDGNIVTKKYPQLDKYFTENEVLNLMEKLTPLNNKIDDITPIDDGDIPF